MGDQETLDEMSGNIKASLALVEGVNELLEGSQASAAEQVQQQFDEVLAALEEREGELIEKAKSITAKKLDELQAHVHIIENLIADSEVPELAEKVATSMPTARDTCSLAVLDDPVVSHHHDRMDQLVVSFGTIDEVPSLPVATMFDAAVGQPAAKGFFARVLKTISEMDVSSEAGFITEADIEMMIAMLDEIKREDVMEQACSAICNIAGTNPELSAAFGEQGGLEMVLGWTEEFLEDEGPNKVAAGACFCIGALAMTPSNSQKIIELDAVSKLLDLTELVIPSICENTMFALCELCKTETGAQNFLDADGIERVTAVFAECDKSTFTERGMQLLGSVGRMNTVVRTQLVDAGIVKIAVENIKAHRFSPGLVQKCCRSFKALVDTTDDERDAEKLVVAEMLTHGAFTLMMECVGDFDTDSELCEVVCAVFSKFGELASTDDIEKSGLTFGSGITNVVKCMEMHPRSLAVNQRACSAVCSLSSTSKGLKKQLLNTSAVAFVLAAMKRFERMAKFCSVACHTVLCLAADNSHARTQVGGGGGVGIILKAIQGNEDEDLCLVGLQCIDAVVNDHKPNADIACHFGAICSIIGLIKAKTENESIVAVLCSILKSLLAGEINNQVKFHKEGGEELVTNLPGTAGGDVLKVLKPSKIKKRLDGTDPTFSFGLDIASFFEDEKNIIPELQSVKSESEIEQQEIVKFSASGKAPDQIKKWRLICVDRNDITVYGGPKETDDNIFTKVIQNYPLSKVLRIRVAPSHKNSLLIECAYGEVGTVVTSSPKRAKEWRDILTALLPLKCGPQGAKQVETNGKKMKAERFLTWAGSVPSRMMLLIHEGNKVGAIAQVIRLPEIESVKATKSTLQIMGDGVGATGAALPPAVSSHPLCTDLSLHEISDAPEHQRIKHAAAG